MGICGAIPLLETHASYCSEKEDDTERIRCIKDSLSSNIGGSRHEKVLLRQLLGVILLSAAAPFSDTDRQREMGDSQLEAWDYLGTTLTDVVAVDMRSGIARLMGVGGSSTAKSQLYTKLAMETVGCLADIGKAAATAGATAAADVGQEVGKAALKGGAGSKGCYVWRLRAQRLGTIYLHISTAGACRRVPLLCGASASYFLATGQPQHGREGQGVQAARQQAQGRRGPCS